MRRKRREDPVAPAATWAGARAPHRDVFRISWDVIKRTVMLEKEKQFRCQKPDPKPYRHLTALTPPMALPKIRAR